MYVCVCTLNNLFFLTESDEIIYTIKDTTFASLIVFKVDKNCMQF